MVQGSSWYLQDVNTSNAVAVTATLTWPNGTKDVDLYWTNTFCTVNNTTGEIIGTGCQIVGQSVASFGTSEVVHGSLQPNQTARFIVVNWASTGEQINLRIQAGQ
jgi:hypothetical protein